MARTQGPPKSANTRPRVVLVTGVSRYPSNRLATQLAADPSIERVIGVDSDFGNSSIAQLIKEAHVDTIVHGAVTAAPRGVGGRASMKELNVIGTMQLLAAAQSSASVRRLVVKSSTAVYGASPRDPAVFTEAMPAKSALHSGYAKDCAEVEGYVRGFSRRRPDVSVLMFRFANFIGPTVETALTRYLSLPVVPTALGFDPRLQLIHEDDALAVLRRACTSDRTGVFNAAADGVLLLSQAIRRAGRAALPIPLPAIGLIADVVRRAARLDFTADQIRLLNFGRVVDSSALRDKLGCHLSYTTESAYATFVDAQTSAADQLLSHA